MEIIKKIRFRKYHYAIGFIEYKKKINPIILFYKENVYIGSCEWENNNDRFYFALSINSKYPFGHAKTTKEMFTELEYFIDIPEKVKKEFEKYFLLYKLNDFNKL